MIISPGVSVVHHWEENYKDENALSDSHVLLGPGRAGVEGELNLKKVFQILELINRALCSVLLL